MDYNKEQVCKLKKSIYGLKQAGKCWNEFLTDVLTRCGFRQSKEDPCLFYVREKNRFLYCGIHVDDMPTVSSDDKFEKRYIDKIREYIDIKDLGEAKVVLGMQVDQKEGKLYVHQKTYIEKLLELYGMKECNAVKTPMDIHTKFENCEESKKTDVLAYQELLGRLMYLSVHTRPDLSFALSCLSQFNNDPKEMHINALKRILRYLRGTVDYRLEYKKRNPGVRVKCESDASWDRTKDAKSFTGLLLYVDGNLIHWRSRKQFIVALSTTESELEAMLEGLKEIVWSSKLIQEIESTEETSRELYCDNLNAVKLANGGNFKTKSKLMNRKCHYIRETVKEGIVIKHVPSNMAADCLTKPLGASTLSKHVKQIMNTTN